VVDSCTSQSSPLGSDRRDHMYENILNGLRPDRCRAETTGTGRGGEDVEIGCSRKAQFYPPPLRLHHILGYYGLRHRLRRWQHCLYRCPHPAKKGREHIERTAARPLPSGDHWHWPRRGGRRVVSARQRSGRSPFNMFSAFFRRVKSYKEKTPVLNFQTCNY
jgi:hypothetical protein